MLKADEAYVHWLKNLKPGDEVGIRYSNDYIRIQRVAKITDTGMIRLENNFLYYPTTGEQRGFKGFFKPHLMRVSDEARAKIAKREAIQFINAFTFEKLSTQSLLDILAIIEKETNHEI